MAAALFRVARLGSSSNLQSSIVGFCLRGCTNVVTTEVEKVPYERPLKHDIIRATSISSLFEQVETQKLTIDQAINVVASLTKLLSDQVITVEEVKKAKQLDSVCGVINSNVQSLNYTSLITTLKNLFSLGMADDKYIIQSVETEILWKIRKMKLRQLLYLLSYHVDHQNTDLQRKIVNDVIEKIQLRWFELSDSRDIIMIFKLLQHFPNNFLDKVEDRSIELVETMSADDQHRILVTLSQLRLRPIHLMRAAAFHLAKNQQKLNVKQMASLVSALHNLSFPDGNLLQKISNDFVSEISQIQKSSIIGLIATAFGQLRWRHPDVLAALIDWFQKHGKDSRDCDWLAFVLTLAHINYELEDDALIEMCLKKVTRRNFESNSSWLDLVWSLVILEKASPQLIASVLVPEFYQTLRSSPTFHPLAHGKKLLNINAAAKWEISGYKGPLLSDIFIGECCMHLPSSDFLKTSVVSTLSNYVPLGKFLSNSRLTETGITIDGEFLVDKNHKPILLDNFLDNRGNIIKDRLSNDMHRVALLVQNFRDFTLHSVELSGQMKFAVRILGKMGFAVMQVPYGEYNPNATTIKRLKYLQEKLTDSIQQKTISSETTGK